MGRGLVPPPQATARLQAVARAGQHGLAPSTRARFAAPTRSRDRPAPVRLRPSLRLRAGQESEGWRAPAPRRRPWAASARPRSVRGVLARPAPLFQHWSCATTRARAVARSRTGPPSAMASAPRQARARLATGWVPQAPARAPQPAGARPPAQDQGREREVEVERLCDLVRAQAQAQAQAPARWAAAALVGPARRPRPAACGLRRRTPRCSARSAPSRRRCATGPARP